jgi:signal transduction histidine kinase
MVTSDTGWSLDGHFEMLVDPSRSLTLDDVLGSAGGNFQPIAGHGVNLGYTTKAAWLRLKLRGRADQSALLSLGPNFVDLVDVYVAADRPGLTESDFEHYAMGDHRPLPDDAVSGLNNIIPLQLRPAETALVYIRLASLNSSLNLTADLYPQDRYKFYATLKNVVAGLWFGGMAVLLVIQLVFYYFERKPFYPLLALSTGGAMLVYWANLGYSRLLFFPDGGYGNDYFTGGAVWFGLFASALTTASILELPERSPWMNRLFLVAAGIGLIGMGFVAFNGNLTFAPHGSNVILVFVTLAMVLGFLGIDANRVGTRLRAAAFSILWIGLALTVAQRAGFWMMPDWFAHTYGLSVLVQTLLLTASLAVRLRAAEALNRAMTAEALVAAQAAEQQVRFMEVISHQYRTPLATIRSNVDTIDLSLPESDTANRGRLDRVHRGVVRLVETLEINLSRSRLQGPSFQPRLVPTLLSYVVAAAGTRGRDLFQSTDILVAIAPEADDVQVMADAEMLGIAIINLLDNAVKFSAPTGAPPVRLSCTLADGFAVIGVHDEGIGVPGDEIAGILGKSVRGSNARNIEGSGMGLSLVSRIAAAHGGVVRIDSAPEAGTTVSISLPLIVE